MSVIHSLKSRRLRPPLSSKGGRRSPHMRRHVPRPIHRLQSLKALIALTSFAFYLLTAPPSAAGVCTVTWTAARYLL